MKISDANQWLIFTTACFALLSALLGFAWKLFQKLDALLEFPSKVADEIAHVRNEITGLRNDVKNTNRESLLWRKKHLREDHGKQL